MTVKTSELKAGEIKRVKFIQATKAFNPDEIEIIGKWCVSVSDGWYLHSDGLWHGGTKSDKGWTGWFESKKMAEKAFVKTKTIEHSP